MELRHLRFFLALDNELHFARAAEKLHIEQSPLSRNIKELEEDLGVRLFERTTRSTRLTRAGERFLVHVPRVFTALEQGRDSVKAVAAGYQDEFLIALSDGITPPRLAALLAQCRQEEPDVEILLFEVPLSQQIGGLLDGHYDVGFAQSAEVGDGIVAKRLAVKTAPLPSGKTSLKVFDVAGRLCDGIGSVLLNDVLSCRDGTGERNDCGAFVAPTARGAVPFIK